MYDGAAGLSPAGPSGKPSPCMLTGVCAESSARRKEAWLSDEAWRAGGSKLGVPTLLIGLEKLNDGRGKPDVSELIEGDRWYGGNAGESTPALLLDILRGPKEWNELPSELGPSSSVDSSGDDIKLDVRFVKIGLGGTKPAASKESILCSLSGEVVVEKLGTGDW